jgi:hypothetical protein
MTLDEIILEIKPGPFIYALLDFATDPNIGGMTPEDVRMAPPLIKAAIHLHAFRLDTGNSGIWKWFEQSYDTYPTFPHFLREIKADRAADYIEAGESLFPNGRVIEDPDERFDFCDEHGRGFLKVDLQFEKAPDEAILKFRDYIVAHRKSFELEAEAYWKIRKENKRLRRKK